MSSIATFYVLPESKRAAFSEAKRNQKTVRYQRGFFGTKEVVTGDRFLWEYLDAECLERTEFPYSGFVFVDYFFTYLVSRLPQDLESALGGAAVDEHHYMFSAMLAAGLAAYLQSHPPDAIALGEFVVENNPDAGGEYVGALRETHDWLLGWFSGLQGGSFGVIHVTF